MFKKDSRGETGITLVATNCEIVGDVHFSDQLQVNGIVKGNIYAQAGSKAKILMISSMSDNKVALDSVEAGAEMFLSKPFSRNEFTAAFSKILR